MPGLPENLLVSDRASLLLPWHRELDALEEARLKDKQYGSTKQGIAPSIPINTRKKTIQAGELLYPEHLKAHLQDLLEWKNLILREVYGAEGYTMDELLAWLDQLRRSHPPLHRTPATLLSSRPRPTASPSCSRASWALCGTWILASTPYTTSSNTIASYAPVGSACPAPI